MSPLNGTIGVPFAYLAAKGNPESKATRSKLTTHHNRACPLREARYQDQSSRGTQSVLAQTQTNLLGGIFYPLEEAA